MTNETTTTSQLVDTLRKLADVIERENLQLYSATVRESSSVVLIDSDFRKLFRGQSVSGSRNGNFVDVSAKAFGLIFTSYVYYPIDRESGEVTIQL